MRAEAQTLLGTRGGSKKDQLPATAGPPLRVEGGKDRPLSVRAGRGSSLVTLVPGRAPATRRCPGPRRKRAESCRAAQIAPGFPLGELRLAMAIPRWPRARRSSPSLPYPPGGAARAPSAGRRPAGTVPLTLLAAAFWRLPFGGDVPQPTSGERRPADHPRPGARTEKATPPLWRVHAETPPRCKPRPFTGGGVVECRNSETRGLLLGPGG